MITKSNYHEVPSGFVSKQLLRILLLIGVSFSFIGGILDISFLGNKISLIINVLLFSSFGTLLLLLNKIALSMIMRLGLTITVLGAISLMLFDSGGQVWSAMLPLAAFAVFGKKEGELWTLAGLFFIFLALMFDTMFRASVFSIGEQINIVLSYIVISLISWFYVRHIESNHELIVRQTTENERLEVGHTLASGVAHLINNEMQGVIGIAEMLKIDAQNKKDSKNLEYIIDLSVKASSHANQLLSYAHGGKICVQAIDFLSIMVDLSKVWEKDLPKSISFNLHMPSSLPSCDGDLKQIRQMLIGLLENAKEACEKGGGIEILVESDDLKKDCQARSLEAGHYLKLSIKDTGHGIEKDVLAKVFEPFFSTKFAGRGLGLAAIHGIVNNHGGHIMVESELGIGSQFTVWLPTSKTSTPNYS